MKTEETLNILDAINKHIAAKSSELRHRLAAEQSCPKRSYYNSDGFELGDLTRYLTFGDGSMVKYLFRAGEKDELETDLMKAQFYFNCRTEQELHSLPIPATALAKFEQLMHQKPWYIDGTGTELVDNVISYLHSVLPSSLTA